MVGVRRRFRRYNNGEAMARRRPGQRHKADRVSATCFAQNSRRGVGAATRKCVIECQLQRAGVRLTGAGQTVLTHEKIVCAVENSPTGCVRNR